jgi:ubiquinone biosynthesis protein
MSLGAPRAAYPAAVPDGDRPRRLRLWLQRRGPLFVKVGQFLALRPDLIDQEYCDELLQLSDRVPAFPFAEASRTIEQDLGAPIDELFSWINPHPLAAASLAQVHEARTRDGRDAAVKIQRPGIREAVERDVLRARRLGAILDLAGASSAVSARDLADELRRWLEDELDPGRELRNLTRLSRLSRRRRTVRIPRPYPDLCAGRVLTAEFLAGVPFTELLRLVRTGDGGRVEALGLDRGRLAANLLYAVLEQVFRFEFFHADTHPGNLLAMPGNAVGFVDFGLVEPLDPTVRRGAVRYLAAIYSDDVDGMYHGLTELLVPGPRADLARFRADFVEESRSWIRERGAATRGDAGRSPIASYLIGVLRAARRNDLRVPPGILSVYRALLTAESLAAQLGGDQDLGSVGRRIFSELQIETVVRTLDPERLQPVLAETLSLVTEGPRQLRRLLSDLINDRFELRVRTSESAEDRMASNLRTRLVSLAIASVGLAVLIAAGPATLRFGPVSLSSLLWLLLVAAWLSIFVLWRRLP